MKRYSIIAVLLAVALWAGLVVARQGEDATTQVTVEQVAPPAPVAAPAASAPDEQPNKKCGFDSDCPYGKCKSGQCGGCGFDSDCKGWGKCKSGQCGGCGFDSDCKGFGKCSSGKCTKSPY